MTVLISQQAFLRALPKADAERFLRHLAMVELRAGPASLIYRGQEQVYLPLTAIIATEHFQGNTPCGLSIFISSSSLIGLIRKLVPSMTTRLTVVQAGYALRGNLKDFIGVLEDLDLKTRLFSSLSETLVEVAVQRLSCASSHTTKQRIARLLIEAGIHFGENREITISHEQIARFLGARRATISEILNGFSQEKIISTTRSRIAIIDQDALQRISCDCWSFYCSSVKEYFHHIGTMGDGHGERRADPRFAPSDQLRLAFN